MNSRRLGEIANPMMLETLVPESLRNLDSLARTLPRLAREPSTMALIEAAVGRVPTHHRLWLGDAREAELAPASVHLVLTSPPYWTLKEYRRSDGQLGWIAATKRFWTRSTECGETATTH